MGLTRSETMYLYKFAVPKDSAWQTFNNLGHTSSIMVLDMNKKLQIFELPYIEQV